MRKINYFCTAKFRAVIFDMAKKETKHAEQAPAVNIEEALNRSEQFFNKNKKIIFATLIAILVIVVGGMLYKSKVVEPREVKAAEAIAKPLPVAAVVLPRASRASVRLRTSAPRPLISPLPPALLPVKVQLSIIKP